MHISSLSLRSIRNYPRLELELSPGVNLLVGDNARGKTNLLEAIGYLGSLRSFRGARSQDMVSWGEKAGSISGLVRTDAGGAGMRSRLAVGIEDGRRRVSVDGRRPENAAGYLGSLKVSSFSPEDLFLVKEYPSHRRRFLDRSIFHLYPAYLELANSYRRALGQLNAALKAGDADLVQAWEQVIAPLAAETSMRRRTQAELLAGRASEIYDKVLGGGELAVSYRAQVQGGNVPELTGGYAERLAARRADGMKRGHCSVGPHTEDLVMTLSGRDMRSAASRGQSRLSLMALVLADCGLYHDERGGYPVLLLDDVGSELDDKRRDALMAYVAKMGQSVLTSTGRELTGACGGECFMVEGDTVKRCG